LIGRSGWEFCGGINGRGWSQGVRQKDRSCNIASKACLAAVEVRCCRKKSSIIVYGHQGVFREALSYCYWPGSVAVRDMEANQSLSRQSVFQCDRPIQSNHLYNLPSPLTASDGTWTCLFMFAALLPSPRCLNLFVYRLSLARPVSVYSAYINRLSLHLSSSAVLVSFACKPTTEARLEIISEDSSRTPSHANAKPCSSLPSYHSQFTFQHSHVRDNA
jgi:hypothetical protein